MRNLQRLTLPWLHGIFGTLAYNREYRAARLVEEAIELAQAVGLSRESAAELIDHVYNRHPGEVAQEVGGVGLTLLALCEREGIDCEEAVTTEFARAVGFDDRKRAAMRDKKRPEARSMIEVSVLGTEEILKFQGAKS